MSEDIWIKRMDRERRARLEAEEILEKKSIELYATNQKLKQFSQRLEKRVEERTEELRNAITQLHAEAGKRKQVLEELRVARDKALELADLKTDFLARMSHEIRTPLNAIIGLTGLLLDTDIDDTQSEHLTTVRSSGRILLRLINDILDMSKIEADKLDIEIAPVAMIPIVEQAMSLVMLDAETKRIRFDLKTEHSVNEVMLTDGGRVQQVLTNLLSNAVKYSDKGTIRIHVKLAESTLPASAAPSVLQEHPSFDPAAVRLLQIDVKDDGIGLKPEHLERLFSPFTQFAGATPGSSGLGLTICKHICERLGGDIQVHSQYGVGSTFTVRIACCAKPGQVRDKDAAASDKRELIDANEETGRWLLLGRKKLAEIQGETSMATKMPLSVLLADDYEVNRMVQQAQLEKLGYRADAVANGEEVLRALHARAYDVVLMDVRMPVMDGIEATRRIRSRKTGPQPFVAAVTASALHGDKEKFEAAGMDAYVSKPVDPSELVAVLEKAYERKQSTASRGPGIAASELIDVEPVELDLSALYGSLGDKADGLLAKVIPVFLRELPSREERIRHAFHTNDSSQFAHVCHGLKGSSRSIGATELASMCETFEKNGFSGTVATETELEDLIGLARRTGRALQRKLDEISSASLATAE